MTEKAALYVRVSTNAQDLEGQERAMRFDADKRGLKVVEVYREKITATGKSARDEYDRALRDVARKDRSWSVLVCWALDRWSRETRMFKAIDDALELEKHYGLRFHFVEEPYLDTPADGKESMARDILLAVAASAAKWEARRIAERTKVAMAELKSGARKTKSGNPYHRPRRVFEEDEALIVRLKEVEKLPWSKVAQKVGLPKGTCSRVYSQYKRGVSEVPHLKRADGKAEGGVRS